MSVQRIDIPASHTHGWQARARIQGCDGRRLTRFFADDSHGGYWPALVRAEAAEQRLKARARAEGTKAG